MKNLLKKALTIVDFLVRVRPGLIQIKLISHLAPLIDSGDRVTPRYKSCDLSLGLTPGERPSEILI